MQQPGVKRPLPPLAYPAGHIFRLGVSALLLTANCVLMRVTASIVLLFTTPDSPGNNTCYGCPPSACWVTPLSVLGSVLPVCAAGLSGAFAVAAAKRPSRCAFTGAFVCGAVLMTLSLGLAALFNALRYGFCLSALRVFVPDIIELAMFSVINALTIVLGVLCLVTLVRATSAAARAANVKPGS